MHYCSVRAPIRLVRSRSYSDRTNLFYSQMPLKLVLEIAFVLNAPSKALKIRRLAELIGRETHRRKRHETCKSLLLLHGQ